MEGGGFQERSSELEGDTPALLPAFPEAGKEFRGEDGESQAESTVLATRAEGMQGKRAAPHLGGVEELPQGTIPAGDEPQESRVETLGDQIA